MGDLVQRFPSACSDPSLLPPVIDYPHQNGDCAIIGGFVYRGTTIPTLGGRFVFADYCSGKLSAVQYGANGTAFQEILRPGGALGNIFTFGRDNAGELYVVAGSPTRVYKLTDATPSGPAAPAKLSLTGFDSANARIPRSGLNSVRYQKPALVRRRREAALDGVAQWPNRGDCLRRGLYFPGRHRVAKGILLRRPTP